MNRKALLTVGRFGMLSKGDEVTVGVSGGADSVALLTLLWEERETLGIGVFACHVNHHLRGEESDADEAFVRTFCAERDIPLVVRDVYPLPYAKKNGLSLEEAARKLRYQALEEAAGNGKVATAHTLSDTVETMLLNLARGTGLRGLCGIPPTRGRIIRPLIECGRAEVEAFLQKRGLGYRTDSSNLTDDYARNFVRRRIVPLFSSLNPSFEVTAARAAGHLREDERMLGLSVKSALESAKSPGGYAIRELQKAPDALWGRMMLELIREQGLEPDEKKIALLKDAVNKGSGSVEFSREKHLVCSGGFLRYEEKANAEDLETFYREINLFDGAFPKIIRISKKKVAKISVLCYPEIQIVLNCNNLVLKNLVDCDKIGHTAILRGRRAGDSIRLAGRGCTKSLKKLMNEEKMDLSARASIAVMEQGDQVFWVERFGVSEEAAVSRETRRAALITVIDEREDRSMLEEIDHVLFTAEELKESVRELGRRITEDYEGKNLLLVGVLKGAAVFLCDLMRSIPIPLTVDFITASSYGGSTEPTGEVMIKNGLQRRLDGFDVLVVEDILDSGATLLALVARLSAQGAQSVRTAVLLDKPDRRKADFTPDYRCFLAPNEFVVGYGLDFDEKYRNLPFVGVLKPEVYLK